MGDKMINETTFAQKAFTGSSHEYVVRFKYLQK
jgi:hypothetical protein